MTKTLAATIGLALLAELPASAASAADHQVKMLNRDSEGRVMQFEPAFLKVAVGDTVTFVPENPGHNSEAFADKIPETGEAWKGKINEDVSVTFSADGFYAYKCQPHVAMGMVGLIQVGEPGAPDAALAEGIPGKGKTRMQELITQAQEQ